MFGNYLGMLISFNQFIPFWLSLCILFVKVVFDGLHMHHILFSGMFDIKGPHVIGCPLSPFPSAFQGFINFTKIAKRWCCFEGPPIYCRVSLTVWGLHGILHRLGYTSPTTAFKLSQWVVDPSAASFGPTLGPPHPINTPPPHSHISLYLVPSQSFWWGSFNRTWSLLVKLISDDAGRPFNSMIHVEKKCTTVIDAVMGQSGPVGKLRVRPPLY